MLCGVCLAGAETFLGVERSRIERVIQLGYGMDPSVEAEIEAIAKEFPDSPVSGVLESGYLYWTQNYTEWETEWQDRFEERADIALEKAEAYFKRHRDDPDARFAVALIELIQTIYYVDHHRWWAAFWKSRGSLKAMRKLVDEYPDYHDAKMPLGMANCYLSKTPGYLKPLAFLMRFKGDWELGIRYLKEARDAGFFLRVDAGYHLVGVYADLDDDLAAARDEFARLLEKHPGNLEFRALYAELERGLGNQEMARDEALQVLEDPRVERYPAIKTRAFTTAIWGALGAKSYELTLTLEERMQRFCEDYPFLESTAVWAEQARAEALLATGRREEALEVWRSISEERNPRAAQVARQRLAELASEDSQTAVE